MLKHTTKQLAHFWNPNNEQQITSNESIICLFVKLMEGMFSVRVLKT